MPDPMPMPTPAEMIYSMQMNLSFKAQTDYVLFESFNVSTGAQFFFALLFVFALALVTESLSFFLWYQKFTAAKTENAGSKIVPTLIVTVFYFLLRMFNYCQMLVAMTFNFWLILFIAIF